jgi:hypothetical protein
MTDDMHHRETLDEIGSRSFTDTDRNQQLRLNISMETRILRLEDEFWRIRTDTGELAGTERNALRAYLDEKGFKTAMIADNMLDELPTPSRVGTTKVGGIDLNKPRMRWVVEAVIALCLSLSPHGFTASELARQVRMLSNQAECQYDARRAAYDLKKLRGKKIVHRIGQTRRYQSTSSGLKAMVALVVLRNKAIKPLLAAAQDLHPSRGAQNPRPLDRNYETIRTAMQSVFQELGLAA